MLIAEHILITFSFIQKQQLKVLLETDSPLLLEKPKDKNDSEEDNYNL